MARKQRSPPYLDQIIGDPKQFIKENVQSVITVREKLVAAAKVNFTTVPEYEALAKAEYDCIFTINTDKYVSLAPNSGNPTLYVEYVEQETNSKIFKAYALTPKALFYLRRDLMRIGANPEVMNSDRHDFSSVESATEAFHEICDPLIGVSCVVLTDEPQLYEGKLQTRFKEVKDVGR